jgi:hypothetical protein
MQLQDESSRGRGATRLVTFRRSPVEAFAEVAVHGTTSDENAIARAREQYGSDGECLVWAVVYGDTPATVSAAPVDESRETAGAVA